jgi:hypothetical protein
LRDLVVRTVPGQRLEKALTHSSGVH